MNLRIPMASLYQAGLLSDAFYYYFWLRLLSVSYLNNNPLISLSGINGSVKDMGQFLSGMCELSRHPELCTITVFPYPTLSFIKTSEILEEEVRRTADTVGKGTYIFNAMQVEARLSGSSTVTVNAEFCARWNIAIADLMAELPKILKLIDRFNRLEANSGCNITWTDWSLSFSSLSISPEQLETFYPLGLSKAAYIFYVLQDNKSGIEYNIDLQAVPEINPIDIMPALATLRDKGFLSYEVEEIKINWLKTLPGLSAGQTAWLGELMKPEGRLMYCLKDALINPASFCVLNGFSQLDFYSCLEKLARKEIINYSFSGIKIRWATDW